MLETSAMKSLKELSRRISNICVLSAMNVAALSRVDSKASRELAEFEKTTVFIEGVSCARKSREFSFQLIICFTFVTANMKGRGRRHGKQIESNRYRRTIFILPERGRNIDQGSRVR